MDDEVGNAFGRGNLSEYTGSEYRGHGPPSQSVVRPLDHSSVSQARYQKREVREERTVKRLRLSKALIVPESTTIYEACRRMAARKVDALLLTDSNGFLCGILTDKDISRVVARELDIGSTPVSTVMTKNPVYVTSDTLVVEALQKMVQGKFRHLPVVDNEEVVSILHIAKCIYDAIARLERVSEKGEAIAAEGVAKSWETSASGSSSLLETRGERVFKPSLSTIILENSKLVTVSPSDTVLNTAKLMLECGINSAVVTVDSKPHGILTSRDILMRVIAQGFPRDSTLVQQVMTPNPEYATIDTAIVDALHIMHDGKFLHLPVVDKDGNVVAVTDVLHITHAAVASVGTTAGTDNNDTSSMMQKFWESAMADDDGEPERAPSVQNAFGGRNMSEYSGSRYGGQEAPSQSVVRPLDQSSVYEGSEYEYRSQIAPSLGAVQLHHQTSIYKDSNSEDGGQVPQSLDAVRPPGYTNVNQAPYQKIAVPDERTVKRLRLTTALTVPDSTTITQACRRMAARRVDALLLTDSNALLCGILTDRDITTRFVARELDIESTPVSVVMTKNPVFVISDTLAMEALQKMVLGKFRYLPVVENGEVVAILDIAKCLYDAISRMERVAEKGKAIAAAAEGVEKLLGSPASGSSSFFETLQERLFKLSLSIIISENSKLVTVSPSDTVLMAAKAMLERGLNSAIVTVDSKPCGILTSRDILIRVAAQRLPPDSTLVEKVMTPNPQCATTDTLIIEALHVMNDGKSLHLPVVDRDGNVIAVTDALQITDAALASVGSTAGTDSDAENSLMQVLWNFAMEAPLADDDSETPSESYFKLPKTFDIKIQDRKGQMHRFTCENNSLTNLITAILQRVGGDDIDRNNLPHILYEDKDKDKVILATDSDLARAVEHARSDGSKILRLHLDYSGIAINRKGSSAAASGDGLEQAHPDAWASAYSSAAAGAALVAGLGALAFMRRA